MNALHVYHLYRFTYMYISMVAHGLVHKWPRVESIVSSCFACFSCLLFEVGVVHVAFCQVERVYDTWPLYTHMYTHIHTHTHTYTHIHTHTHMHTHTHAYRKTQVASHKQNHNCHHGNRRCTKENLMYVFIQVSTAWWVHNLKPFSSYCQWCT